MKPNPLLMCYANDAHLRAEQYAGTTAVFVLGRVTCTQDAWQRVRDRGSEILKYENHIERPDNRISAADEEVYMADHAIVPLWPYLDANGQQRCHKVNGVPIAHKFTDIRVGSPYVAHLADHVAAIIRSKRYSGLFLDGDGAQLFGSADWANWPVDERQEWTAGMVEKARLFDEVRRAENPGFLLIGNNHWDTATVAEKYVDGVVSENHPITNAAMVRIVGKTTYSPLGQRRVFTLSNTKASALQWATVAGVTHVGCNEENIAAGDGKYAYPTTPVVGYSAIKEPAVDSAELPALREANAQLKATNEALAQNLSLTESLRAGLELQLQAAQGELTDPRATARRLIQWAQG